MSPSRKRALAAACLVLTGIASACSSSPAEVDLDAWKTDDREPYPFQTPIPPRASTPIDGTYVREYLVEEVGEPVPCRRCAPYRIYAGSATLAFTEGRYHVSEEGSSFASSGHYVVDGDSVTLFNDVVCPALRVDYSWSLEDGVLTLTPQEDPCAFDNLRGRYLAGRAWSSS